MEDKIAEQTLALDALNHEHIKTKLACRTSMRDSQHSKRTSNCSKPRPGTGQAELDLEAAQALMRRFQERSVCQERIADLDAQFDALKSAQERSAQSLIEPEGTTPTSIKPTWHVAAQLASALDIDTPCLCVLQRPSSGRNCN